MIEETLSSTSKSTEDRRYQVVYRRHETSGSVQKIGDIRQCTKDRRYQAVHKRQEIAGSAQKTGDSRQCTKDRRYQAEDRGQLTWDRIQGWVQGIKKRGQETDECRL